MRILNKHGDTLEFMLSEHRDEESAFNFLRKCIGNHGLPKKITIDKSGANDAALIFLHCFLYLEGLWPHLCIQDHQIKNLNNIIEQDYRHIKDEANLSGFKSIASAESAIAGYELINMLRKGQHVDAENMTIFEQFYGLAA
jgi:putative transposase